MQLLKTFVLATFAVSTSIAMEGEGQKSGRGDTPVPERKVSHVMDLSSLSSELPRILKSPEEIMGQILTCPDINVLYLLGQRSTEDLELFKKGFVALSENTEALRKLAHSPMGASRLFPLLCLMMRKDPSVKAIHTHLLEKAGNLWSGEITEISSLPQFNCGIVHLLNDQPQQAVPMFEQAIRNGFHPAFHGLGLSCGLLGKREKCSQFEMIGLIEINRMSDEHFKSVYDGLVDFMLLSQTSPNARTMLGMRLFSRGDFVTAEKILLFSQGGELCAAENMLAKLYMKTNHPEKVMFFLEAAANGNNTQAQMRLARRLLIVGQTEEANALFQRVEEKKTAHVQACLAYKLVMTAIKLNDPHHFVLDRARRSLKFVSDSQKAISDACSKDINVLVETKLTGIADGEYHLTLRKVFDRGTQSYHQGDKVKAGLWWSFVVEFEENEVALNNLGVLAVEAGDLDNGKDFYYKAAKNGYTQAIQSLLVNGVKFAQKGDFAKAKEWLLLAAEFNDPQAKMLVELFSQNDKK